MIIPFALTLILHYMDFQNCHYLRWYGYFESYQLRICLNWITSLVWMLLALSLHYVMPSKIQWLFLYYQVSLKLKP